MAATVKPEQILKDLAKLWIELAKEDTHQAGGGVLRACAMTLVAAVEQQSDAQAVGGTLAELMHEHPSRAIVLRVSQESASELEARVFAQCWMPFGRRQQICCEQIEISSSASRVEDLPKLVLGLIAPDLPVVLWCLSERLCLNSSFQQLLPLADKIIVDSSAFSNPDVALQFIRKLDGQRRNVVDLAWTRLTRWRETVAQIFEGEQLQNVKKVERITVTYATTTSDGADAPLPLRLRYLNAWLHHAIPSAKIALVPVPNASGHEILGIALEGPDLSACVRQEETGAVLTVNQLSRRILFPKQTDYELLREELGILGKDPIFKGVLHELS
jgi:hypothetical protein